jgi:hypothetical protein
MEIKAKTTRTEFLEIWDILLLNLIG